MDGSGVIRILLFSISLVDADATGCSGAYNVRGDVYTSNYVDNINCRFVIAAHRIEFSVFHLGYSDYLHVKLGNCTDFPVSKANYSLTGSYYDLPVIDSPSGYVSLHWTTNSDISYSFDGWKFTAIALASAPTPWPTSAPSPTSGQTASLTSGPVASPASGATNASHMTSAPTGNEASAGGHQRSTRCST